VLAPDDRSVLLDMLRPPPEMRLDVALATTFTLDLDAALVAPLAFAAFDASGPGDPIAVLEAIRSVAERLTVFCQAGEIRVPSHASDLFAFLEPVVHEVHRPRPGRLFHPKLWVLRYKGDNDEVIRLLVPTRNLTNDASWDAVLRLDGSPAGGPVSANRPVADLILWCMDHGVRQLSAERRMGLESLIESVRRTRWEYPKDVQEIFFHTLGISRVAPPDFAGRRHLVISPFVTEGGLRIVAPSGGAVVISRPDQLEQLTPEAVQDFDCRVMTSVSADTEAAEASPLGALHAKIIVKELGQRAHLFVGSPNATDAAYGGNIEILVEMIGGRVALGIDTLLGDLAKVLEPCQIQGGQALTEAENLQATLEELLREGAIATLALSLTGKSDETYLIDLSSRTSLIPADLELRATIELLSRPGHALEVPAGSPLRISFGVVPIADITPFLVLRIDLQGPTTSVSGSTVVRAQLIGDPPGRFDAVIARQVNSPAKFLRFLFLLLGVTGGGTPPWLQANGKPAYDGGATQLPALLDLGVFEALARALATNPSALDDLGRLVDRLRSTDAGRSTLPEGFDELWSAVTDARTLSPRRNRR
jgi:hypothetical protein